MKAAIRIAARFLGAAAGLMGHPGTRILCYHRVNDEHPGYITVPVKNFREQMDDLAACGFHTISLKDLFDGKANTKSVVITFDDGYADNYEHAFLAMKKHGFSGTIFCIAEKIGMPGYLTVEQVRKMKSAGFEFGSHTVTHPNLRQVESGRKRDEIFQSKKILEDKLRMPMEFFCYPYGIFDTEASGFVAAAGYRGACSNTPGANGVIRRPFELRRTEIADRDTLEDFRVKLKGGYDCIHRALHLLRGRP